MSLRKPVLEDRGGFFIPSEPGRDWRDEDDMVDQHRLILLKADALASENRLREAIEMFSIALRHDAVRPEQLGSLVGCILRNFKKRGAEEEEQEEEEQKDEEGADEESAAPLSLYRDRTKTGRFDCPACGRFIGEAVSVSCGHSYCRGCVERGASFQCLLCREEVELKLDEIRPSVVLCGLLDKWFPEQIRKSKAIGEAEGLLRNQHYDRAVALATKLLQTDPISVRLRVCRAEAYRALQCYHQALDDCDVSLSVAPSLEGYFCKAKVLLEMGQVDDSLQLFLQCLAVDENFQQAKQEVEMILHDMLSPASESVQVSLRETSAHTHSKAVFTQASVLNASIDLPLLPSEIGRSESLERSGLNRAHSLRSHGLGGVKGEGLKRVCSAPQLGDQEKCALLKRKLSGLEVGPGVVNSHISKHKKQGVTVMAALMPTEEAELRCILPRDLLDPNDFECSLCMRLFYEPVTTPCGHTFCKNCLERCLDHSPQCPLCKESLKVYLAARKYCVTQLLDDIIKLYLSEEHTVRAKLHTEETKELSDLHKSVPIFVCTMAYPTVPCPLHVFEPRYRLMIRRCIETGTRQFGMCIHDAHKGFADYGCMLHIRSVHFLPDGRSVVDTVGGKRFRVLSRHMRDGYCTADIDYLEDQKVVDEEELGHLQLLHDQVYDQARDWFHTLENRFRNQILQHFGPMPEREADIQGTPNGPACCWWLLAVLPVDPRYQLSLLSMTTLKERLIKIQHILTYLQNTHNE